MVTLWFFALFLTDKNKRLILQKHEQGVVVVLEGDWFSFLSMLRF